ncbi:MAG: ABC transporter ATP-binding protein [Myxococcales bacterium]|nr:ABC transporter ATP-binding protein [Myxococcales bacterium]MDD9971710.1 ABC transporter ATP-binding protein [Myxococcales bacterium]
MTGDRVLEVVDLHKTFHIGFFRKRVDAVRGLSFDVRQGEVFGFVGPNGAGKTTTMKMVLQLIFPNRGHIKLFGMPAGDRRARARLGYMPENPYIYSYLRPLEFLDLCGRLCGMPRKQRVRRSHELIEQLGLDHALDRPIGKFSKGMMQRIGMCQALLHDPELLVLDEPFSGLDPIGRKDIRDILQSQRQAGKTIIITSHVLTDVEAISDRVAIVQRGKLVAYGDLQDLLRSDVRRTEVELGNVSDNLKAQLQRTAAETRVHDQRLLVVVEGQEAVSNLLSVALRDGAQVHSVTPHKETLEDLFVRKAKGQSDPPKVPAEPAA